MNNKVKYSFPYLLLTCNGSGLISLYFAYEPITEKTTLYTPQLPNFGGGSTACLGNIKLPDIRKVNLPQYVDAVWNSIFRGVYTAHSKADVYDEMGKLKTLSKYARIENAGKPLGKLKSVVNKNITQNDLNLFREW